MAAIETNGQSTIVSTRTLAMVNAAVHDALNAVSRRYDAYYFEGPGNPGASPEAAVAVGRPHGAGRSHSSLVHGSQAQKVAPP